MIEEYSKADIVDAIKYKAKFDVEFEPMLVATIKRLRIDRAFADWEVFTERDSKMTFVELKKKLIETYGVKKQHTCPFCGFQWKLNNTQRFHLAECMQENPRGIWAYLNCPNCGYIDTIYPTAINGVKITKAECEEIAEKWGNM